MVLFRVGDLRALFIRTLSIFLDLLWSIYAVHDEVKDKAFELELSWVGEGKLLEIILKQKPSY